MPTLGKLLKFTIAEFTLVVTLGDASSKLDWRTETRLVCPQVCPSVTSMVKLPVNVSVGGHLEAGSEPNNTSPVCGSMTTLVLTLTGANDRLTRSTCPTIRVVDASLPIKS